MIQVLEVLEALEENRILEYMLWRFEAVGDDKTCPECASLNGQVFDVEDPGELESMFPYGRLAGPTLFYPNIHPNCRCRLTRIYYGEMQNFS